jgi:negative regulator of replication initiation
MAREANKLTEKGQKYVYSRTHAIGGISRRIARRLLDFGHEIAGCDAANQTES